jgi:hypothetical protein
MDTTTGTLARRIALLACLAVAALAFDAQEPAASPRPLTLAGATALEERAVGWAFHRFGEAGLGTLPALDVHLHRSHVECQGGLGLYFAGRIDLCPRIRASPTSASSRSTRWHTRGRRPTSRTT